MPPGEELPTGGNYSEEVGSTCSQCAVNFRARLWITIDGVTRPDLLEQARLGQLRRLTCPNGHEAGVALPLLIQTGSPEPAIVFYPSTSNPAEIRHQFSVLLGIATNDHPPPLDPAFTTACVVPPKEMHQPVADYHSRHLAIGAPPRMLALRDAARQAEAFDDGVAAWESIVLHPAFAALPFWFRCAALAETGAARHRRYKALSVAADLDRAVEAFGQTLELCRSQAENNGALRYNFAVVSLDRFNAIGDPANLEQAVTVFRSLLPTLSGPKAAWQKVAIARALMTQSETFANPADFAEADSILRNIDGQITFPQLTIARAQLALNRQGPADEVIDPLRALLPQITNGERREAANLLGCALHRRFEHTGQNADLDDAIRTLETEITGLRKTSPELSGRFASLWNSLVHSLRALYRRDGRIADLETASRHAREGLNLLKPGDPTIPALLNQWGGIMHEFFLRDKIPEWLDKAIELFQRALRLLHEASPLAASMRNNLGLNLMERYRLFRRPDDLRDALTALDKADISAAPTTLEELSSAVDLAIAWRLNYQVDGNSGDLARSIAALEQALGFAQSFPADEVLVLWNLAMSVSLRQEKDSSPADVLTATSYFRRVSQLAAGCAPEIGLKAMEDWGSWALRRGAWDEAAEAYRTAMDLTDELYNRQNDRFERESWLRDVQRIFGDAAYAFARCGDCKSAVLALERGRARLLSETLRSRSAELDRLVELGFADLLTRYHEALAEIDRLEAGERVVSAVHEKIGDQRFSRAARGQWNEDPGGFRASMISAFEEKKNAAFRAFRTCVDEIRQAPGFSNFLGTPGWDEIQSALNPSGPLAPLATVYLIAGETGSLALVMKGESIEPVWMPVSHSALAKKMIGESNYFGAQSDPSIALETLEPFLQWTGDNFVGPFIGAIGPPLENRSLLLIPTGLFTLLPLHVCTFEAGCRILLDDYTVAYAVSATVWGACAARLPNPESMPRLVAIANPLPLPEEWPPLANAETEVAAIQKIFEHAFGTAASCKALSGAAATKRATENELGLASHLHFACHGIFDRQYPPSSSLLLGSGERLSLQELASQRWAPGLRLAVLSACQTAVVDAARLPEEAIGLASALLEAGLPCVAGSLWEVSDISTALLMACFYSALFEKVQPPRSPADAMRIAQNWLRRLTREELDHILSNDDPGDTAMRGILQNTGLTAETLSALDDLPFGHPWFWAGFVCSGV